ncbi:cytochrome c biogenesis heme-transporting ATPase CcmA [Thiopseudomonas alkaliphila]|uniref:cytochrome c biogenesis heme-transporting ATPase CcmA n=1 Tax=Thiopseudomonas alkaliphila TaxID=1697053 RepID=UPI0035715D03
MSHLLFSAENLSCERDGRLLFQQLSFTVQGGDMLQVVGPNGCGKSSLLRLVTGMRQPSSGHIQRQSSGILWIGHAPGINGLLSAEENLSWLSALTGVKASAVQIQQALTAVGLRGFEDVPCHTLSAGQQRRVALARLYLPAAALWVLDEPFTALDKAAVAQLEQHLAAHCEQGGAVILTTHHDLQHKPQQFAEVDLSKAGR